MRRKLTAIIATIACVSVLLAGCGDSGNKIKMATGGTSGTYYGFMGVVAQTLNTELTDLNITVESTGASKANIQLVDAGECNMGIVQNDVMYYAYTGTDMFAEEGEVANFSAVAACYPETVQIISNTGITSIEDLKGKKVSVGDAGSGVEFNARQILAAYGLSFDDIVVNNQSFADSADSLKNGTIDAAFVVAGAPTTAVTELSSTYDFNILSIDAEHAAALQNEYGFYTTITIPAGTYSCVTEDAQTVAVMATIIASNDLSEEVVYEFTKGLFEYKDEFEHAKAAELDAATAVNGISIPFHPGAEKYFKEIGVIK